MKKKWLFFLVLAVVVAIGAAWLWRASTSYAGADTWVRIAPDTSAEALRDSLQPLGEPYASRVAALLATPEELPAGAYRVAHGERAYATARRINRGQQTPLRFTFNNLRLPSQLAARLGNALMADSAAFVAALDTLAMRDTIPAAMLPAHLMPDTYEFYWTATPQHVIATINASYLRFWNDERRQLASNLGLTPHQAAVIASIAEEETNARDERATIARLYLNRLQRGMPLQADPTVKYATQRFDARRITPDMLADTSPYNTYRHPGLPPGPIRLPEARTIDALLHSSPHSYLYMCASPDFSGRHLFTTDFASHRRNAAAYRAALNRRNIRQ